MLDPATCFLLLFKVWATDKEKVNHRTTDTLKRPWKSNSMFPSVEEFCSVPKWATESLVCVQTIARAQQAMWLVMPSRLEAGLSQDPGGPLHETDRPIGARSCRPRDAVERNSSSPLRAGQDAPELGRPRHSCRNTLRACLTVKHSQKGDRKKWHRGSWVTVFSRACSLRRNVQHLIRAILLQHLASVESRNRGAFCGALKRAQAGHPKR